MKSCAHCTADLPDEAFTLNRASDDGLSKWCRPCQREYRNSLIGPKPADWKKKSADKTAYQRAYMKAHPEKRREYERRKYAKKQRAIHGPEWMPREIKKMTPEESRVARLASIKKTRTKHRDRYLARKRVERAVADGRLLALPCWTCGVDEVEAHHADYSQPLQVVWLCRERHASIHRDTL